jgi:hypothetical protein
MARSNRTRQSAKSKRRSRTRAKKEKIVEHGDIFFFYRPKVGTEEVKDIENVEILHGYFAREF